MAKQNKNQPSSLTDYHFKFILLANLSLLLFYTVFRIYMAAKLVIIDHLDFFVGLLNVHEEGRPYYTLYRVFFPIFITFGFIWLYNKLFGRTVISSILKNFLSLLAFEKRSIKRYALFVVTLFFILSLAPGFALLIKNPNTVYGATDADSYVSIVALMNRGDYNGGYFPEGGLQFGKYYINTIPTLILTWIMGFKNLVASYNITTTFLVFFTILNFAFSFRNFIYSKEETLKEEIFKIFLFLAVTIATFCLIVFQDNFNFNGFLQVYCSGFLGSTGGLFLLSCVLFSFSYLLKEQKLDGIRTHTTFLTIFLFGCMLVQDYFNLTLFFLPIAGMLLALLLSQRNSFFTSVKFFVLYGGFLAVNYASFRALDIFPRYHMDPIGKLTIIIGGLITTYLIFLQLNIVVDNLIFKLFAKFRQFAILGCFSVPFFWYINTSGRERLIKLMGFPILLGDSRTHFFWILWYALFFSLIFYLVIKLILRQRISKILPFSWFLLLASLILIRIYVPRKRLPLIYPAFFHEELKYADQNNSYVFDGDGVRVTYNGYLVDVIKYFLSNHIPDFRYWIVSRTPSLGIYEHGYLQRMLYWDSHHVEGITIIETDAFAENIFNFEKETRNLTIGQYNNRYLIIDDFFPQEILSNMGKSAVFHQVYQNKLYRVYKMGNN